LLQCIFKRQGLEDRRTIDGVGEDGAMDERSEGAADLFFCLLLLLRVVLASRK